jgi:hypothetical protein
MGQDAWNLQYGKSHPAKYRKGTSVDMHSDEGYGGAKMIPGYAGAYKNEKTKVVKKPKMNQTAQGTTMGYKSANESFTAPQHNFKRRK